MAYNPLVLGQQVMASSQGVVIASNQSPVSVLATITGNPSVSGQVGASIIGLTPIQIPGSVAVAIISGSIAASFTPPANQSVSGTVGASIIGAPPVTQGGTWVASVFGNMSVIGTVPVTQATTPWVITGSVQASLTPAGNQSVSGTVGASVIGLTPVQVPGSVAVAIISGSIAASFTPPANQSVSGTVQTDVRGSVAVAIISGSIAASFTPPANQSVSGTVGATQIGAWTSSVVGSVSAFLQSSGGSVISVPQGSIAVAIISGSIAASFTPPANQSVSGTVGASIIGQLPAGTAPLGSVAVLQGTNPWIVTSSVTGGIFPVSGSVAAVITNTTINVSGSVAGFIVGNASIITLNQGASILAVPVGSTIALIQGSVAAVQAGTHIASTITLLTRNDTLASTLGADLTTGLASRDSAGRTIIKPFISDDGNLIEYNGSVVSGSVTLIKASAIGKRNYITDFWLNNTGGTTTLVTFQGGDTSTVGYGIAPAGGGESSPGISLPLRSTPSQDLAFKVSNPTSILYLTVKGYQAP